MSWLKISHIKKLEKYPVSKLSAFWLSYVLQRFVGFFFSFGKNEPFSLVLMADWVALREIK